MAHTCPDCGQYCTCNGDIDDCCNDFPEDVINCTHYLTPDCQSNDDDYPNDIEQGC
jgi:hypothetical protein